MCAEDVVKQHVTGGGRDVPRLWLDHVLLEVLFKFYLKFSVFPSKFLAMCGARPQAAAPHVTIISILGLRGAGKTTLAKKMHDMFDGTSTSTTTHKAVWMSLAQDQSWRVVLKAMLQAIEPRRMDGIDNFDRWEEHIVLGMITTRLRGKRFLIVVDNVTNSELPWSKITEAFKVGTHAGSAILLVTSVPQVAHICTPQRIFDFDYLPTVQRHREHMVNFLLEKAVSLVATTNAEEDVQEVLRYILTKCSHSLFSMKMFLRSLCVNPDRNIAELRDLCNRLDDSSESTIVDRMLAFCYHSFPSHYRNCLAYLAIFPEDYAFKRTTLVRRWLGEGLISRTNVSGDSDLTEVANRCFDALCAHKFLLPAGDIEADTTGGRGRFKKCTVHGGIVRDFLSCIVGDEHVVDAELLPHMDRRISIQNYLLQQSRRNNPSGAIMNHLETLDTSSLQLLNVLDLEGCSGFTEEKESRYLRIICAKATHLRYLSLRNTGVSQLPRQIQNLQQLETLDIRGTDVRELDDIMLPMLKNLHAGKRESSNRSISTIWLPRNIRMMAKIVVLSHVKVSDRSDELISLGRLLKLRTLGVVLTTNSNGDQDQLMKYLLSQIERLHNSLRSLSIRTDGGAHCTADYNPAGSDMLSPPVLLQNLTISGIRGELPNWIGHLRHLAKISLQETYLPDDMLRVLGSLHSLQSLKLLRKALAELTFDFRAGEFMNLVDLLFEEDGWNRIRSVIFDHGTAPMLERVVLRVKKITSIHGIQHLPSLKDLHVIGDLYEVRQVMRDVKQHPNCPRFQY
uniref:Uncharacterized protein n=1 Tax=Oryza barthii TaxID=65489 RepID=A0A0D3HPM2_9ORYZ